MKSNSKYSSLIVTVIAIAASSQLDAQGQSNASSVNRLKIEQVSQRSVVSDAPDNLPTLEEVRSRVLWNVIGSIISNYHYYVTPGQLEKLLCIKINDREYSKDGHVVSRYEDKVTTDEKVRSSNGAVSTLSLQLENFTPSSHVPLWKVSRGWRKSAWYSVLNISDSYSCRPLGDVEKDLVTLGMKKETVSTKIYGAIVNENSVYVDPRYNAKIILYYTSPAVTNSCVSSVEIIGLGHLKVN